MRLKSMIVLMLGAICMAPALSQEKADDVYAPPAPLLSWDFKAESTPLWTAVGPITNLRLDKGKLKGKATGPGATLASPRFEMEPNPHQAVELVLKVDRDTSLAFSYDYSRYDDVGGKMIPLPRSEPQIVPVNDSRRAQRVRILPFWQGPFEINRFHLDLGNADDFEIESVKVIDLATQPEPGTDLPDERGKTIPLPPTPNPGPRWTFAETAEGWSEAVGADYLQYWIGTLFIRAEKRQDAVILSPPLSLEAGELPWATVRIKVRKEDKKQREAVLFWPRPGGQGVATTTIPLKSDNRFHSYTVKMSDSPEWRSRIGAVGLRLPPDTEYELDYLILGDAPFEEPINEEIIEPAPETP